MFELTNTRLAKYPDYAPSKIHPRTYMNNRQRRSIRRPIRLFDVVQQITWRIGTDGKLRQGTLVRKRIVTHTKMAQN